MSKKILLAALTIVVFLSSCLTSLHNLVTYENVVSDDRVTGSWQYGDLSVRIEKIPESSWFKKINSSVVNAEIKSPTPVKGPVTVNGEVKKTGTGKPVTFEGEVKKSATDSTTFTVNGEVKKSGYDSKEDSLLYSKSYIISFTRNNYHFYMACCLTRIGDDLYADLEPLSAEPVNKPNAEDINDVFNSGKYMSSHSIAKLVFRNNEIEFRILNGDFIRDQLTNGFAAIKYETDALFGTSLITTSSAELRQLLLKYGKDERLYSPKNTVILKKIVS